MALRVLAPNAIRPIEDLVPLPTPKVSYGTIQRMLVEAEGRAARLNAQVSLIMGSRPGRSTRCSARASRCWPDLDSGYLFLSATRDGGVGAVASRGSSGAGGSSVVVKDAAKGIAAGVSDPRAEQRDDCFHVLYEMACAGPWSGAPMQRLNA